MALKIPVPSKRPEGQAGKYVPPPAGTHAAVLVAIVELGTQLRKGQMGKPDRWQPLVYLGFELTGEDDNPTIGIAYTASMHEMANLRGVLTAMRGGKAFSEHEEVNLPDFLGKPCMVTIAHQQSGENTYAKLVNVSGYPAKIPPPAAPKNQPVAWEFTPTGAFPRDGLLADLWLWGKPLSHWVREAKERKAGAEAPAQTPFTQAGQEDPIPF